MAATTQNLTKLLQQTHLSTDEEVLEAATASLKASTSDETNSTIAQRCRVIALLKLDRFEDAVRVFEKESDSGLKNEASLEYAYALYKMGRWQDAAEL